MNSIMAIAFYGHFRLSALFSIEVNSSEELHPPFFFQGFFSDQFLMFFPRIALKAIWVLTSSIGVRG